MKTNVLSILNRIEGYKEKIDELTAELEHVPFYDDIRHVAFSLTFDAAGDLAKLVSQRDFPADRSTIKRAFELSGFEYTEVHITASKPDSDSAVKQFYKEACAEREEIYGRSYEKGE